MANGSIEKAKDSFSSDATDDCDFSQLTPRCRSSADGSGILNVYKDDVDACVQCIAEMVGKFNIVSIDTEFAGTCVDVIGVATNPQMIAYQNMAFNVKTSKLIQLGMSLSDGNGRRPKPFHTFQFNFSFDVSKDPINISSRELLINNGMEFERNKCEGINQIHFSYLITYYNIIANQTITWVSFQGSIDFAYLVKLVCKDIPSKTDKFFDILRFMFPVLFDIKSMTSRIIGLDGGVSKIAKKLEIKRIGKCHSAGSDSMLCLDIFNNIKEYAFHPDPINIIVVYNHRLYGLETLRRPPVFSVNSLRKAKLQRQSKLSMTSGNLANLVISAELYNVVDFKFAKLFPDPRALEYTEIDVVEEIEPKSILKHVPMAGQCRTKEALAPRIVHKNTLAVFSTNIATPIVLKIDLRFLKFIDRRMQNEENINISDIPIELFKTYSHANLSIREILSRIIIDMVEIRNGNYIL